MFKVEIHLNFNGDRVAMVDSILLTKRQTEQALRDSTACRCSSCVCCKIRDLYFKEEDNVI